MLVVIVTKVTKASVTKVTKASPSTHACIIIYYHQRLFIRAGLLGGCVYVYLGLLFPIVDLINLSG